MIRVRSYFLVFFLLIGPLSWGQTNSIYIINKGTVRFYSEAKQELISASSDQIKGAIDMSKKSFLFKIGIASFIGFNNPLQREHFNENYMETDRYPEATYSGKIIEDVDVSKNGEYDVRSKGKLKIHGIERERIIKAHITCKNGMIKIECNFIVPLAEHDIKIPRIVMDKLAPDINVTVTAILAPNS